MGDIPASIDLNPLGEDPKASVIWLHGLGADGNDFVPLVERLNPDLQRSVRFVFPHAPLRSITINGGMLMPAWYDIAALNLSTEEDSIGIQQSAQQIRLLIEREQRYGIRSDKIVLAGFSQGGAIALHAGLRLDAPLAGIIVLSAYLPLSSVVAKERHPLNQSTPIFMANGLFDPIVPFMLGQMAKEQLVNLGYTVHWHSYSMAHTVIPEEIEDIDRFLQSVL